MKPKYYQKILTVFLSITAIFAFAPNVFFGKPVANIAPVIAPIQVNSVDVHLDAGSVAYLRTSSATLPEVQSTEGIQLAGNNFTQNTSGFNFLVDGNNSKILTVGTADAPLNAQRLAVSALNNRAQTIAIRRTNASISNYTFSSDSSSSGPNAIVVVSNSLLGASRQDSFSDYSGRSTLASSNTIIFLAKPLFNLRC